MLWVNYICFLRKIADLCWRLKTLKCKRVSWENKIAMWGFYNSDYREYRLLVFSVIWLGMRYTSEEYVFYIFCVFLPPDSCLFLGWLRNCRWIWERYDIRNLFLCNVRTWTYIQKVSNSQTSESSQGSHRLIMTMCYLHTTYNRKSVGIGKTSRSNFSQIPVYHEW